MSTATEIKRATFENKPTWLEARRGWIGATDAVAILGESRHASPVSVWANKAAAIESNQEESEEARWGTLLEPVVREEYGRLTNREIKYASAWEVVWGAETGLDFIRATLDGEIEGPRPNGIYEGKNVSAWLGHQWKDDPPLRFQIQGQHQLLASGRDWVSFAALIGGNRLRWYDMERNDRFIRMMVDRLSEFWKCVETKTPPVADAHEATRETISLLHPKDNGETILLSQETLEWSARLDKIKTDIGILTNQRKAIENRFKLAIGAATYGMIEGGPIYSYKTTNRKGFTVEPSEFRVLRKTGGTNEADE